MNTATRVAAIIDSDGPYPADLCVEQNVEQISTLGGRTAPDLGWSHVDKAGHYHAYLADGSLPTLDVTRKRVPCTGACHDDTCEGQYRTVYRCGLCRKKVTPATTTSYAEQLVHGPASHALTVWRMPAGNGFVYGNYVSVVIEVAGEAWTRTGFGFGLLSNVEVDSATGATLTFVLDRFGWRAS